MYLAPSDCGEYKIAYFDDIYSSCVNFCPVSQL